MHIVTGGAGFIGSAFVAKLNEQGINEIIVVDELDTSEKWQNLVGLSFSDYIHKDKFLTLILDRKIPAGLQSIIHMGACSSTTETDSDFLLRNNYEYSREIAKYALEKGVRLIYASSAATYGDGTAGYCDDDEVSEKLRPLNRYGYSKQLFDLWVLRTRAVDKVVGLKFFNVYGPNEYHKGDMRSVVHKAYEQVRAQGKVRLFRSHREGIKDGEQKRDFLYIKDCTAMMWEIFVKPDVAGIFNVGTGAARTWNDLARAVFAALEKPALIEYIDMPEGIRDQYQYFTEATMEKLKRAGVSPKLRTLEEGVKDYVHSYLENDSPFLAG